MTTTANPDPGSAASRYSVLSSERQHFIDRAHECAKVTLPMLFQRDAASARNMKIADPEQSLGTRGVNTMASKMVLTLLPLNSPFFKINLDDLGDAGELDQDTKKAVLKGISKLEKQALKDVENSGDVAVLNEMVKHLLVTGNVAGYVGEKATRLYSLNKYVVVRDSDGIIKEAVIEEEIAPEKLPKEFLQSLATEGQAVSDPNNPQATVRLYTHIVYEDGRVSWHQEALGRKVPGTDASVPEAGSPWLFLRYTRVDGEDYGRSHVEMYLGDLKSLEVLSKAVTDASKAAAKVIFLVRPNSTTSAKVLASAPNLAVRTGDANDVTVLRLDKSADMRIAREMIEEISRRLAHAFMLRSEVMRDAERVTAEEVRIVARELDESNGGVYSLLSREFQLPYVNRRLFMIRRRAQIPPLPDGVSIAIVTGYAALGRHHEGDRLMRFIEKVNALLSNPALAQAINVNEAIKRLAISDGIEVDGLIPDPEDQANSQQQDQMQQMMMQMMPELLKQIGPAALKQMEGQPNDGQPATAGA